MFNVVEQLFMILETLFKCGFTWAKVAFLFVFSDVKVNVGLINYAFVWQLFGRGQVSLLQQLRLSTSISLDLSFKTMIMHISVGIHIRDADVANFHIGPVKRSMPFTIKRKMHTWLFKENVCDISGYKQKCFLGSCETKHI